MWQTLGLGMVDHAIYMLDPDGIVINWSAGAERTKGYSANNAIGHSFDRFYTVEDRATGLPGQVLSKAASIGSCESEGWRVRRDGSRFWASVTVDAIHDGDGILVGFAKTVRDLSDVKRQSDRAARTKDILNLALDNMSQGLVLFDRNEKLAIFNSRARELWGGTDASYNLGCSMSDFIAEVLKGADWNPLAEPAKATDHHEQFLARLRNFPAEMHSEVEFGGKILALISRPLPDGGTLTTIEDVTQRRQAEQRAIYLAKHDPLTGLPNRAAIQQAVAGAHRLESAAGSRTLLYLDLDRFKPVNDSFGHAAGDHILRTVAERIRAELRKDDVAVRLGGDEFAIVAIDCADPTASDALGPRLIRSIGRPIRIEHGVIRIGVSIGIVAMTADGNDADTLLQKADLALYCAKEAGRGQARIYEPAMAAQRQQRSILERELREALAAGNFLLHYQPVLSAAADVVTSFEALIRWTSPTQGALSPDAFVPFAEEIGLMPEIDDWVLRQACTDATSWPSGISVSVNVSPTQFQCPGLSDRVAEALALSGLSPSRLELEITETAAIHNVGEACDILQEIRSLGVGVALDDFGTGHSSLSLLRTLPFTRIKIDRSFIRDLETNVQSAAIVHAVCDLCRSFGVRATAEGVETRAQAQRLRSEGCTEFQGYLYGKPLPLEDALARISHTMASDDENTVGQKAA